MDEKKKDCLESDSKNEDFLHFHLVMLRDMCLHDTEEYPRQPEESECCTDGAEGSEEVVCSADEVLINSENYAMTHCAKQHDITPVCRSLIKNNERGQLWIQSIGHTTLHPEMFFSRRRRKACMDSNCGQMTIYYYKSNTEDPSNGWPVVLNFSGSNQFLKCMYKNEKPVLTVECWEHVKLKSICMNDKTTWPFVFFLSVMKDNCCYFESAACSGCFIHIKPGLAYACTREEEKVKENTFRIFS